MRSFRLHLQLTCLFVVIAISTTGCQTMNGYAANSSGMGYYEQGNYTAAASEFQQAMLANPANPDYVANFARSRMKLGDAQGAEQLYRQALSIAPSHQPSYHGLAETLITAGRSDEAANLLTTWAATQPYVAESHIELAWLQREMGQPDASVHSLQRTLQVNPGHSTALAHLGQYYEENGRPDQAVAIYQRSLQSDWNQPEVHSRLAAASQNAGPASPMAATAMARGVHPYNVPRQQTAFGPPSRGAQMAQMQMAQTQMAMRGDSLSGGPMAQNMIAGNQMPGAQLAAAPNMNQGMMSSYYAPGNVQSFGNNPPQNGWRPANSVMNLTPDEMTAMSFGTGGFESGMPESSLPGEEWSFEGTTPGPTPSAIPQNSTPNTAVAPTPDPAFSTTEIPNAVTNVSWSAASTKTPIADNSSNEPPLVEAF